MHVLARGWQDNPKILLILKNCTRFDEDSGMQLVALEALARDWKEDPVLLGLIVATFQSRSANY